MVYLLVDEALLPLVNRWSIERLQLSVFPVIYKAAVATLSLYQNVLPSDRAAIDQSLMSLLPPESTSVTRAMRYAVLGPGQRLRPMLALRVCRAVGGNLANAMRAARAVELLHCASLIVDDLPCMDNDATRRDRPSLHVKFGEATAVLAAFALVALAARSISDLGRFQLKLLGMLDCSSLIGGQALDLECCHKADGATRSQVTALKTVPLFCLAIEAGLVSSVASRTDKEALLTFGSAFGTAYQITDDYLDGEISDLRQVTSQVDAARECAKLVGRGADHLEDLLDYLNAKIWEDGSRRR